MAARYNLRLMEDADVKQWKSAPARLVDNHWVVEKCPHCGKRHVHGAGAGKEDPHNFLGHRNLYCHPDGYILVEAEA
jgi:hypothetical protein